MKSHAERTSEAGPDDDALVAASQRGDQAAFGEIVRRYQRAVHRLAWSLTRNASDADDLAQETFVRAWGAIGRFERSLPLYPWLARIVTNLELADRCNDTTASSELIGRLLGPRQTTDRANLV